MSDTRKNQYFHPWKPHVCSFIFFVEANNIYVQENLNVHLKSKT